MDAGETSQGEDRRSTKRRKPGSASSFDSNPSTKPAKQTKDNTVNFNSKTPTCDERVIQIYLEVMVVFNLTHSWTKGKSTHFLTIILLVRL